MPFWEYRDPSTPSVSWNQVRGWLSNLFAPRPAPGGGMGDLRAAEAQQITPTENYVPYEVRAAQQVAQEQGTLNPFDYIQRDERPALGMGDLRAVEARQASQVPEQPAFEPISEPAGVGGANVGDILGSMYAAAGRQPTMADVVQAGQVTDEDLNQMYDSGQAARDYTDLLRQLNLPENAPALQQIEAQGRDPRAEVYQIIQDAQKAQEEAASIYRERTVGNEREKQMSAQIYASSHPGSSEEEAQIFANQAFGQRAADQAQRIEALRYAQDEAGFNPLPLGAGAPQEGGLATTEQRDALVKQLKALPGAAAGKALQALSVGQTIAQPMTGALWNAMQDVGNAPKQLAGDPMAIEWRRQQEGKMDVLAQKPISEQVGYLQEKYNEAPLAVQLAGGMVFDPLTYVGGAPIKALTIMRQAPRVRSVVRATERAAAALGDEISAAEAIGDAAGAARLAENATNLRNAAQTVNGVWKQAASLRRIVGPDTGLMNQLRSMVDVLENRVVPVVAEDGAKAYDELAKWGTSYTGRTPAATATLTEAAQAGQMFRTGGRQLVRELQLSLQDVYKGTALKQAVSAAKEDPFAWLKHKVNLLEKTPGAKRGELASTHDALLGSVLNLNDQSVAHANNGVAAWKAFIFDPDSADALRNLGTAAQSADGRVIANMVRDLVKTPQEFDAIIGNVKNTTEALTKLQSLFDEAARAVLPDPKRNPAQILMGIMKSAVYSPIWLGTRPGYIWGNFTSNLWPAIDGGVPSISFADNVKYFGKYGMASPETELTDDVVRSTLRARGVKGDVTEAQMADMRTMLQAQGIGSWRKNTWSARHATTGLGGETATSGPLSIMAKPVSAASSSVETRFSLGYFRKGHENAWNLFSDTLPTKTLEDAGYGDAVQALKAKSATWVSERDVLNDIQTLYPKGASGEMWRAQAMAAIGDLKRTPGSDDIVAILDDVLKNDRMRQDDWIEAVSKAYRKVAYKRVPEPIRAQVEKAVEAEIAAKPLTAADEVAAAAAITPATTAPIFGPDEAATLRQKIGEGTYSPKAIEYIKNDVRRDSLIDLKMMEAEFGRIRKSVKAETGDDRTFFDAFSAPVTDANQAYANGTTQIDNTHATYRATALPDGTPGPLTFSLRDKGRGEAWLKYFGVRDNDWLKFYDDESATFTNLIDDMRAKEHELMTGGKAPPAAAAVKQTAKKAAKVAAEEVAPVAETVARPAVTEATQPAASAIDKAMGGAPAGAILGQPHVMDDLAKEQANVLKGMLNKARQVSNTTGAMPAGNAPADILTRWANTEVRPWMATRAQVSTQMGAATRDFAIMNYADRRNIDSLLAMVTPFHFWQTRMYSNMAQRVLQQPSLVTGYLKYKAATDKINKDLPVEYQGSFAITIPFIDKTVYVDPSYLLNPMQSLDVRVNRQQGKTPQGELAAQAMAFLGRPYPWLAPATAAATGTPVEGWQSTRFHPWTPVIRYATSVAGMNEGRGIDIEQPVRQAGTLYDITSPLTGSRQIGVSDAETEQQLKKMLATQQANPITKLGLTQGQVDTAIKEHDGLWREAEKLATASLGRFDIDNPNAVDDELLTMLLDQKITQKQFDDAVNNQQNDSNWRTAQAAVVQKQTGSKSLRVGLGVTVLPDPTKGQLLATQVKNKLADYYQKEQSAGTEEQATQAKDAIAALYKEYPWLGSYQLANDIPDVRKERLAVADYYQKVGPIYDKAKPIEAQLDALKGKTDAASKEEYSRLYEEQAAIYDEADKLRTDLGLSKLQIANSDTLLLARYWPEQYQARAEYESEKSKVYDKYAEQMKLIGAVGDTAEAKKQRNVGYDAKDKRDKELADLATKYQKQGPLVISEKEQAAVGAREEKRQVAETKSATYDAFANLPPGLKKYTIISDDEQKAWIKFNEVKGERSKMTAAELNLLDSAAEKARNLPTPNQKEANEWQVAKDAAAEHYTIVQAQWADAQAQNEEYWKLPKKDQQAYLNAHPRVKEYWHWNEGFRADNPVYTKYYYDSSDKLSSDITWKQDVETGLATGVVGKTGKTITEPEATKAAADNKTWNQILDLKFPDISSAWDTYYAEKAATGKGVFTPTLSAYINERNQFAALHPEWNKVYGQATGGTPTGTPNAKGWVTTGVDKTGKTTGYYRTAAADLPGYLSWQAYPGGTPPSPISERLGSMWSGKRAQGVLHPKPPVTKGTTPGQISTRPKTWFPDNLAVSIYGTGILKSLDEYFSLPRLYRVTYLKQHPSVVQYLQMVAQGPQALGG